MKILFHWQLLSILMGAMTLPALGQGNVFTCQGSLNTAGSPTNSSYGHTLYITNGVIMNIQ